MVVDLLLLFWYLRDVVCLLPLVLFLLISGTKGLNVYIFWGIIFKTNNNLAIVKNKQEKDFSKSYHVCLVYKNITTIFELFIILVQSSQVVEEVGVIKYPTNLRTYIPPPYKNKQ